ncbi:MAG: efflux RND transporter periplasmic adaptor subunit, partial [Patescibacteria group bacterium]|nr:efflux RND transporter periplasmic adaptor subunit [Patescibacteria group bacterium]
VYIFSIFLFLVAAVIGVIALRKTEAQDEKQENIKQVKVIKIEKGLFSDIQEYSGLVKGIQETNLAPKISGRIIEVYKKEGDIVQKGELLAVIDGSELFDQKNLSAQQLNNAKKSLEETKDYYDQLVDQAEEELDIAKDVYDEAKDEGSSEDISTADKNIDRAEESVKSAKKMRDLQEQTAENQVSASEDQLKIYSNSVDNTRLIAPYAGVVTRKYFDAGRLVSPQSPIFSVADSNQKEIEITIPGSVAKKLSLGSKVEIEDSSQEIFSGQIKAISPVSDMVTRKSLVKVSFENDENVRLGELMNIKLKTNQKERVISIPLSAVRKDYHEDSVFVLKNDVVEKRIIDLGNIENDRVEIINGVEEGDVIVVEGQSYLKNNEKVNTYE